MKEQDKIGNLQSGIWKKMLIIAFWLVVWQIVCRIVDNPIFFAGPLEMIKELVHMAGSRDFIESVLNSLLRIMGGFCIAFLLACLLASAAYHCKLLEDLLSPFVTFIKSVPVASVVVLLLIWFGAKYLSIYVTFMVVFPNIYLNVLNGLKNTDQDLLEMAEVFHLSLIQKLFYIYRPAVMPYLLSGTVISVGMSFKSGVAAEVIGLPVSSIGEGLYNAKIYLNTAGVFAWTAVIIALSSLAEWLVVGLLKRLGRQDLGNLKRRSRGRAGQSHAISGHADEAVAREETALILEDVTVSFGEKKVLNHMNASFDPDRVYCVMGPSGCGKTTLLRVCAGLQETMGGRVGIQRKQCHQKTSGSKKDVTNRKIGMVFQEDRLCMQLSALNNVLLTADRQYSTEIVISLLSEIFPKEALQQPAIELSGGMRRRIAVARAVLSDADCLLLDEPFAGLDEENHERLSRWILQNRNGRLLVVTTHDEADIRRMGAVVLKVDN
ncbi:MAG: ATP-binding cassette domain-containing protein [Lachnospiraceae bacterium]|nr:ATP-binding cassette domain-containing protein [Lachnospiraceae bacterium]